jgi:hypothetical protein
MKQRETMIKEVRKDNSRDGGNEGSDVLAVPPRLGSTQPSFSMFYTFSGSLKQSQHTSAPTREPFSLRKLNANRSGQQSSSSSSLAKHSPPYLESLNLKEQPKPLAYVSSQEESDDESLKRRDEPKSEKLNEKLISKINEIKFSLDHSLIDQIYSVLGLSKKVNVCNDAEQADENAKVGQDSSVNELVDKSLSKNLSDLYLSKEYFSADDTSFERVPFSCVYEYLGKINGSIVPVECFEHVVQQLKHCGQQNQNKLKQEQRCERNDTENQLNTERNNSEFESCLEKALAELNVNNHYFKCELVYGECYYWICKVRRFVGDLYQLKLIKSREISQAKSPCVDEPAEKCQSSLVEKASPTEHYESSKNNNQFNSNKLEDKTNANSSSSQLASSSLCSTPSASIVNSPKSRQTSPVSISKLSNALISNQSYNDFHSGLQSIFFSLKSDSSFIVRHLRLNGWSKKHSRQLKKPHLANVCELDISCRMNDTDCNCLIKSDKNSESLMNQFTPTRLDFSEGSYCDLVDEYEPKRIHLAFVKRNIADRLLIEYIDNFNIQISSIPSTDKFTDLEKLQQLFIQYHDNLKSTWLFYSTARLKPLGWLAAYKPISNRKDEDITMKSKRKISSDSNSSLLPNDLTESKINSVCESSIESTNISSSKEESTSHDLRQPKTQDSNNDVNSLVSYIDLDHCMECLYRNKFYAIRVVEVNKVNGYFKMALDYEMPTLPRTLIYYIEERSSFHTLFPCKWCSSNNLRLQTPSGWSSEHANEQFDWDIYLAQVNQKHIDSNPLKQINDSNLFPWLNNNNSSTTIADKFQLGMYLECVDNREITTLKKELLVAQDYVLSSRICLAQIKARLGNLLFLELVEYSRISSAKARSNEDTEDLLIYTYDSTDIYPTGWCEMNNYYPCSESYFKNYISIDQISFQKNSKENKDPIIMPMVTQSNIMKSPYLSQFKSLF